MLKGRFGGERECTELMNSELTQVLWTIFDPRTFCARSYSKEKRAGVENACDRSSRCRLHSPVSAYFSLGPYEALGGSNDRGSYLFFNVFCAFVT